MSGFIQGEARHQTTLFPEALDDYITEENPIRVIDAFVDSINLTQCSGSQCSGSGLAFCLPASY